MPTIVNLNYKRGLLRLYAALSVLWIAVVLVVAVRDSGWIPLSSYPDSFVTDSPATPTKKPDIFDAITDHPVRDYWVSRTSVMLLPPALGYAVLFLVMPWIGRGFKND